MSNLRTADDLDCALAAEARRDPRYPAIRAALAAEYPHGREWQINELAVLRVRALKAEAGDTRETMLDMARR